MFHQIRVWKSNQDALRFVWRECQLKPIEDYVMCVHVFGKLDSPCIANYTLKKTAVITILYMQYIKTFIWTII